MTPTSAPVWFITGASSGFGAAFANYALDAGYNVVATARNLTNLLPLAEAYPDRVLTQVMDVTSKEQTEASVAAAVQHFGKIDVLINNAGYGIVGAVEETPEAELRDLMETNFFGAVSTTQTVLPIMRTQGFGAIVNITSMGGVMSFAGFGPYSASKFALEGLSEALAQEMEPFGVKVMIVEPGAFRTNFAGAKGMRHMPQIDAYGSVVGSTREFAKAMDNTQEGDPAKAARLIDVALQAENTPLRLQLGQDAIDAVRAHSITLIEELDAWSGLTHQTALDTPTDKAIM